MDVVKEFADLGELVKPREPLAPLTSLNVGGPAEAMITPQTIEQLCTIVKRCHDLKIPLRLLGAGSNVLISDDGLPGVVLRLSEPAFTAITCTGKRVKAGGGASLSALINAAAQHGLAGLETLIGTPGTVGGAVRMNTGDRSLEIGQYVHSAQVIDAQGHIQTRDKDEVRFGYRTSSLDEPVIISAEFELEQDSADAIVKRLRKAWIQRKANEPYTFQRQGRIFRNPKGLRAASLIEQAGLVGTKVGGAEVSDRHANYIVAQPGTSARDVLRLIDLVSTRVQERFQVELELEISVW